MPDEPPRPSSAEPTTIQLPALSSAGSFDRYRLLQRLGEGGMGEVWLAEQIEPVHRQVALKVIKAGMDSVQVIARFEAERQALALMDHPAIATVFDGGTTPQGRPFFAMEYVKGEPITVYCDRHRLSTRERLELFMQVCDGVQHAHQKGIIHRDLKPSNVLVAIQGERAVPKIIDFGVAKATAQRLTERTLFTELGVLIGTPEYMSPEQAEMGGLDIDTRTDIYGLGVLLYELLTGSLPFDRKELRQAGLSGIQRIIREKEPPRPSARITQLGPASAETATNRRTEPRRLVSELRGDLDWIAMRALEKDRTRRYQTANALAMDVGRHLNNEPVSAGPPSAVYRTRKFVRRHRAPVAGSVLAVVLLTAFAVAMGVQAQRIRLERDRANQEAGTAKQVSDFLTNLFQLSDPMVAQGHQPSAREILDRGAQRIESELSGQPSVLARLQSTMAKAYENLGLYDEAEALYLAALKNQTEASGPDSIETISIRGDLANIHWRQGRLQEAEKELQQTIAANHELLGKDDPSTLRARSSLANLLLVQGRYEEAEEIYQDCVQKMQEVLGEDDPMTVGAANNLALALSRQGKNDEAERLYLWVVETRRRTAGENHPHTLGAEFNLAEHYVERGRIEEAEKLLLDVLERRRKVLGEGHPDTLTSLNSIGNLYTLERDTVRAEQFLRSAYEGRKRALGEKHSETLVSGYSLGRLLLEQGRTEEGRALIQQAIDGWGEQFGANHPNILTAKGGLARAAYAEKRYAEAERLFREELAGWKEYGEAHPRVVDTLFNLACVSALQRENEQALGYLKEAVRLGFNDASGFEDPDLASLRSDPEFQKLASALKPAATE